MLSSRRKAAIMTAAACLILAPPAQASVSAADQDPAAPQAPATESRDIYTVPNTDAQKRTEIVNSGAVVMSEKDGTATVEATRTQAEQLRQAGFAPRHQANVTEWLKRRTGPKEAGDFPAEDRGYHNYEEVQGELDTIAREHPDIAAKSSAGTSFEGRDIPLLKISDNVAQDEDEPEVLFDCNQHAREHLTTEMCMRIANRFTGGQPDDPNVREMVDNREIYVIPMVNPDGSIYDYSSGEYQGWRKNRQDAGTDLNRNWGFKWGCCGGSSGDPNDETFRGNAAFSAPETTAVRNFIDSRVVDGRQQIKAAADFHTYSELVLWPFGHTQDDVTEGMTQQEHDRFSRVGNAMAETNGYTPQQSSDLYVTDGDTLDWMWGKHKILGFTFEMFPAQGGIDGFYPPDEVIPEQTARNDAAVDILLREAGA